jgi:hypothetical protein
VSTGAVYVDPARHYIPVKFVSHYQKRSIEIEMSYAANARIGWVLSGWVIKLPDPTHEFAETRSGNVKYVSINEPIDDKAFALQYPPGTRVREDNGGIRRFFIVQPDGSQKQVDPSRSNEKKGKGATSASLPLGSSRRRL